jgi:hypothetical protein
MGLEPASNIIRAETDHAPAEANDGEARSLAEPRVSESGRFEPCQQADLLCCVQPVTSNHRSSVLEAEERETGYGVTGLRVKGRDAALGYLETIQSFRRSLARGFLARNSRLFLLLRHVSLQ